MKVKVNIINAFIDGKIGGNPAGVVMNSDKLSHNEKLKIAKKIGLSETAFVSKSKKADFKLDFYTPSRQIAHCGHATIAVFSYLSQRGLVGNGFTSKETIDGTRKILIQKDMAYMEQIAPRYEKVEAYEQRIIDSLNIKKEDLFSSPMLVNTGNSFVIIGIKNESILTKITQNSRLIETISDELDLIGYYLFTTDTVNENRDATTRMFAPRYGIIEESATGMAAGPLACYLHDKMELGKNVFNIEQGYKMLNPSPSMINVKLEIEKKNIISLMAGGRGKLMDEISIVF